MSEVKEREAYLGIVIGEKGGGKTYATLENQIKGSVTGYGNRIKPRRVLILDINNEYGNVQADHKNYNLPTVKALDPSDLKRWNVQPTKDVRRISVLKPVSKGGGKMDTTEFQELLFYVLDNFTNGLLIIEDMTNFISDSISNKLIGSIVTQRHSAVDIIIHFQFISKAAHPKLWPNANWIRFHKTGDTVDRNKTKIRGDVTPLYIAEKMIYNQTETGNPHFFAYINKSTKSKIVNKVSGAFSQKMFVSAIEDYLSDPDNERILNRELKRKDLYSGRPIHKDRAGAINFLIRDYMNRYYGNPDYVAPQENQPKKIARPDHTQHSSQTPVK